MVLSIKETSELLNYIFFLSFWGLKFQSEMAWEDSY